MKNILHKSKQHVNQAVSIVIALLVMLLSLAVGAFPATANADTAYTDVLTDLQKDTAFNAADYPDVSTDYSISVIQLAESEDGAVFLYTYQPAQKTKYLVATDINIAFSTDVTGTRLQKLTLVSSVGTLCKYKLDDYTADTSSTRYYNISAIYREWDSAIDNAGNLDNTLNAVAYKVGQCWRLSGQGDNIDYYCKQVDIIEITDAYCGFLRFYNGHRWGWKRPFDNTVNNKYTDIHYVAFSTDLPIDTLYEADIQHSLQSYTRKVTGYSGKPIITWTYGDKVVQPVMTVKSDDIIGNTADGFKAKKYEWNKIESADTFLTVSDLTDDVKTAVGGLQWVLSFYTSPVDVIHGASAPVGDYGTRVSDVTILRLKFEYEGQVYNLGAVANKTTEGDMPSNTDISATVGLFEWLANKTGVPQWTWVVILIVLLLLILLPILSLVFPLVGVVLKSAITVLSTAVKYLLLGLWWLVCLPFRGIVAIVRKIQGNEDGTT